ncbi:MAG: 2-hydroxy-acid oxidase [Chloroflexi bacterium RBG_16_57_11]|nr:MAG: 2-hydroxy-acid oxidase [Chloroflexi bacterium RBG_16_57_11]
MQHTIPVSNLEKSLGPQANSMAQAIESCIHCGFCLAVCPTYQVLGEEMDSPRGRIVLMKSVLEGDIPLGEAIPYIDRCLGCLACVTACPSGVRYGELVTPFRAYARGRVERHAMQKVQHSLLTQTLPYTRRFRSAITAGKLARPFSGLLPDEIQTMLGMLPKRLPDYEPLPAVTPAEGPLRARVALLVGCVQEVLAPEINRATLRVLSTNGVEVIVPAEQGCCGALLLHTGDHSKARALARQNLSVITTDVDAILTNAAGCGSGMKDYELLFKGRPEAKKAVQFAHKVQDVSQFLAGLGMLPPPSLPQPLKVAYHDACHLAHAQGITAQPRSLLAAIPNLTLVEIQDSATCCGSAGTYNLEQPEIAAELGQRKALNIIQSGAEAIAMCNIGCMVQIRNHLQTQGKLLPVFHVMELLDMAYTRPQD